METCDVVIIGAGPAGLSAAIQLRRYGIDPLIFERQSVGGLLCNANLVENYPGFPDGIVGVDLVKLFWEQAKRAGVVIQFEEVTELDYNGGLFRVITNMRQVQCPVVVVASGTKARNLDLEIPKEAREKVAYEVHPLSQVSNKQIVIIGAGDAAFDYALNLAKANRVLILNRGERVRCLALLWQRVQINENICYEANSNIRWVQVDGEGLQITATNPFGEVVYRADYLVGAIGREPAQDFLSNWLKEYKDTLIQTGVLYFIGDVTKGIYRQTAIAVGEGILTAMKIHWRREELVK